MTLHPEGTDSMTDTPEALEPEALFQAVGAFCDAIAELEHHAVKAPGGAWLLQCAETMNLSAALQQAIRAYLSTPPQAPGVVKPLQWEESNEGYAKGQWFARSIFGEYCTYMHSPSGRAWLQGPGSLREFANTIEEAKAAAQADFERLVLSTLVSAPPVSAGELVERLRPSAKADELLGYLVTLLRDREEPTAARLLNEWIVQNNALKSEAVAALTAANADRDSWRRVAERLEGEREALARGTINLNTELRAAEAFRDRLARELEEAREALKPFVALADGGRIMASHDVFLLINKARAALKGEA